MVIYVRLKTGTFVTKIAAVFMRPSKGEALATTIGKTIHLHNISTQDFISRMAFLRHELQHAIQYQTIRFFALKYIWETLRKGYFQNKYEVEAREKSIHEFPKGYAVYNDELLCVKAKDFSDVELAQLIGKLKFRNYPKVIKR